MRQHRGQPREILQAGIELVGAPGPEGTAEAVSVLCAALDAAGLVLLPRRPGRRVAVPARAGARRGADDARPRSCTSSPRATSSGLERELERVGAAELLDLARTRGGVERRASRRPSRCASSTRCWRRTSRERVIFDLGLVRTLGYYTGAVFEVYDAAFGSPLGGGGRYDDLLGRFGRELPACGWALDVERVHAARLEEGR